MDELAAIVGMESANRKRKLRQHRLQDRDQPRFRDLRGGSHHFPLRHFIHSIDVINAFAPVQLIALMDGVHTQISRSPLWIRPPPPPNAHRRGPPPLPHHTPLPTPPHTPQPPSIC